MSCPLRAQGLELRHTCADCDGTPERGQEQLRRGDLLYFEGAAADAVLLVVEGLLAESRSTEDGREQGMRLVEPGAVLGAEALVEPDYKSTVTALTDARVCRVPLAQARATLTQDPAQGLALSRMLAREVMSLQDQILRVTSRGARERVVDLLERIAPQGEWFTLPMRWTDVAMLLGLTPETVSRQVGALQDEGQLETDGRRVRFSPT